MININLIFWIDHAYQLQVQHRDMYVKVVNNNIAIAIAAATVLAQIDACSLWGMCSRELYS